MLGIMKPAQELMSFAFVNIWNSGTRTATNGTIIASISIRRQPAAVMLFSMLITGFVPP
jgi:hypothetical protein